MKTIIKKKQSFSDKDNLILLCGEKTKLSSLKTFNLSQNDLNFIKIEWANKEEVITINHCTQLILVIRSKKEKAIYQNLENIRLLGEVLQDKLKNRLSAIIIDLKNNKTETLAIAEGIALSNYAFVKHKSKKPKHRFKTLYLYKNIDQKNVSELQNVITSVFLTKDLINEPFSHLTAIELAKAAKTTGKESGFKTTILKKSQIKRLKMGGLLAVNKGSIDEPTFTIMEWKPKRASNKRPLILVGKGIVFDTGGLSLKPTANSMDMMKVDMGGAGTVIGVMRAVALNKLNVHVIGLIPATDNRPSGNAYAPGDVITMHNGSTVEVLNTDAEGRLILADALSFAKKYNPELVIDLATLTGSAAMTIGHYGIVSMQEGAEQEHEILKKIGFETHERLAEMPFWSDYEKLIESDVADIKNLGGASAGAITAGKFLAHFIDYPWIHLDIAGCTFVKERYGYRGKGATGVGVRLLYQFIKNKE